MDIAAIPIDHGIDSEKWMYYMKQIGVLFYDGARGEKPFFMKEEKTIKMCNVDNQKEMDKYKKEMDEMEAELDDLGGPLEPTITEHIDSVVNDDVQYDLGSGVVATNAVIPAEPPRSAIAVHEELVQAFAGEVTEENFEQVTNPYGLLTEERIVSALEEIQSEIENLPSVDLTGSPLTDQEVVQLDIEDPRVRDNALPQGITQEENTMMDEVMNTPAQIGEGYTLTDDTN